ncbi:hypothetical protein [Rhizobium leguminosarum]|uniref:hypothetical protein n=1 Tax=Rhizobium leguminosarum TaxID=384 RepID=UPI000369EBA8|nr:MULTISPECIES: hypothetical protein [Rhizobium]
MRIWVVFCPYTRFRQGLTIENEEPFDFLRREGCLQVQGFLFGRPGPRSGIEAIVNGEVPAVQQETCAGREEIRGRVT